MYAGRNLWTYNEERSPANACALKSTPRARAAQPPNTSARSASAAPLPPRWFGNGAALAFSEPHATKIAEIIAAASPKDLRAAGILRADDLLEAGSDPEENCERIAS